MPHRAILLPGAVLPADLAYGALAEALGDRADVHIKDLELYADDEPPPGYGLDLEIAAIERTADEAGLERFHLAGYSAGGAISAAFATRRPQRLLSLTLFEPAWLGNAGLSAGEQRVRAELARIRDLPPDELMGAFVRAQLAPGVEPPAPPSGPSPPWMAKRPAGIRAVMNAFERFELDTDALRAFAQPVLFVLGGRSNPDLYGRLAERAGGLFTDFTLEVFEERHHFDPPHRAEPERLAGVLTGLWDRVAERP